MCAHSVPARALPSRTNNLLLLLLLLVSSSLTHPPRRQTAIMKFTTTALLTSSAAALLAAAQQQTTVDTIISNIQNITNESLAVQTAANNLTTLADVIPLNEASTGVQAALNLSIANAKNLPKTLDSADGIKLIPYIQQLGNASVGAITALISHQAFFINYTITALVLPLLELQNQTSYEFNDELTKRNSPTVREGSEMLAKPITDALAAGIKAFTDNGTLCNSVASCYEVAGVGNSTEESSAAGKMGGGVGSVIVAGLVAFVIVAV